MEPNNFHAAEEIEVLNIEEEEIVKIKVSMNQLYSIWNEIGLEKEKKVKRVQTAWSHIQSLIHDICCEEAATCDEIKKQIESYTNNIKKLSKLLSIEMPKETDLTLLEKEEKLRKDLCFLVELKEKRLEDLKKLRNTEQKYCTLLGVEEYKLSSIPSDADLNELLQHINMLKEEHDKRYKKYCQATEQFIAIIDTTGLLLETPLEKHILDKKEPFSLTKEMFFAINEIIKKVEKKKLELEKQKQELVDRLTVLWERLNIEPSTRVKFLSDHANCKVSTLKSIKEELERCEKIKRENIQSLIVPVRKELDDLWNKCTASDSERELFQPYFSAEITEDILNAHEKEIIKWKERYEDTKAILEKIEKRNKLRELLNDLENKAKDPERFKNRGGNLLREERERNKIQKDLPSLESEICKGIKIYETEKRKKFFYHGQDYMSQISDKLQEQNNDKENTRPKNHFRFVTPNKRLVSKTPKSAPCPRLPTHRTPVLKYRGTPKPAKRAIKKFEYDALKGTNTNQNGCASNITSYSEFSNELNLSAKKHYRSSVLTAKKLGGTRTAKLPKTKRTQNLEPLIDISNAHLTD